MTTGTVGGLTEDALSPWSRWQETAARLDGVGAYSWMASRLYGVDRVLEVGCGAGNGTLALVLEGMRVVAFEVDQRAVQATLTRLRAHGVRAEATMSFELALAHPADVVVVCLDFLRWIQSAPPAHSLDAVVCWNTRADAVPFGAHAEEFWPPCDVLQDIEPLHRAAYSFASKMAPGTTVHLVEQVSFEHGAGERVAQTFGAWHRALAASEVNVVPGLTAIWPYRTSERIVQESQRPCGANALPVAALVSTVGFVC